MPCQLRTCRISWQIRPHNPTRKQEPYSAIRDDPVAGPQKGFCDQSDQRAGEGLIAICWGPWGPRSLAKTSFSFCELVARQLRATSSPFSTTDGWGAVIFSIHREPEGHQTTEIASGSSRLIRYMVAYPANSDHSLVQKRLGLPQRNLALT